MENKKVKIEVAIGIILLLAIIIGGIFWMQGRSEVLLNGGQQPSAQKLPKEQFYYNDTNHFGLTVPPGWYSA